MGTRRDGQKCGDDDEITSTRRMKRRRDECPFSIKLYVALRACCMLMAATTVGLFQFRPSGMSWDNASRSIDAYSFWMSDSIVERQEGTSKGPYLISETIADASNRSVPMDTNIALRTNSFVDECSSEEYRNRTMTFLNHSQQPFMPTFVIAGAQKSGTSALYYLLKTIQKLRANSSTNATTDRTFSIHSSIKFESHFFTHQMKQFNNQKLDHHDICTLRQLYRQEFEIPLLLLRRVPFTCANRKYHPLSTKWHPGPKSLFSYATPSIARFPIGRWTNRGP
jgi:hypothetical protein